MSDEQTREVVGLVKPVVPVKQPIDIKIGGADNVLQKCLDRITESMKGLDDKVQRVNDLCLSLRDQQQAILDRQSSKPRKPKVSND